MADDRYKRVLERADGFFAEVAAAQPQNLQCGRGCSLCCHGLFEIGSGDVPMIIEGLSRLEAKQRRAIIARARKIMDASDHPDLRECSGSEKRAFFDRTSSTPCPNLDGSGACLIYASRPLVCRTFGLPLRDGPRFLEEVCELNFTAATKEQRESASWDLTWEDVLGREDAYTIPEAIVLAARLRGW